MTNVLSDIQSEMTVLGMCLTHLDDLNYFLTELTVLDFSTDINRKVYKAIQTLSEKSQEAVDIEQVIFYFDQNSTPYDLAYLVELTQQTKAIDPQYLVQCLHLCTKMRAALDIGVNIQREMLKVQKGQEQQLLSRFSKAFDEIGLNENANTTLSVSESAKEMSVYNAAVENQTKKEQGIDLFEGLRTNFKKLDQWTSGLCKGHLIIIGARPGQGKTSLMINLVHQLKNFKVAVFSLEMGKHELLKKLIAQAAKVDYQRLQAGTLTPSEINALYAAEKDYQNSNIIFDEVGGLRPFDLKLKLKRIQKSMGLDIVFIDYLQLMHGDERVSESNQIKVATISRSLKQMAKEFKIPIVALAQVNREAEKKESKKPSTAELRESGAIEADADHIWLLHCPSYYNPADKPGQLNIIVGKNRFGQVGEVSVYWDKKTGKMGDLHEEKPNEAFREFQPRSYKEI